MTDPSSRIRRLLRFLELDPGNLALRIDAIREAFDEGRWDAARELIDAGLGMQPTEPRLRALSAHHHLQALHYQDAELELRSLLAGGTQSDELRYTLAYALFMQRRFADALEQLNSHSMQVQPALARVLRARCLHHLRRPLDAIEDLQACLEAAPRDAQANGLLALLLHEQGRGELANAHIRTALEQQPDQVEALLVLASMQTEARELAAARSSYDALLQADSRCGRAWLGLALLELNEMRLDAAERDIEAAATHMPEHIGTWHMLGWTKILRGDIAGAASAFDQALALDRNFGETHGGLAVIAALHGRDDEARLAVKRALRLDPQCLSAQYAHIVLLRRQGRNHEAQHVLDAVLTRQSGRGGATYRDLVMSQLQYLHSRGSGSTLIVYH